MDSLLESGALEIIADLLEQHCWNGKDDTLDSGYITIDAQAMRFLASHGRFKIIADDGGRYVYGKVI